MEDLDFEEQLRHRVNSQPLSYDAAAWQELSQRLDGRDKNRLLWRSRVNWFLKPALAAALLLIAVLALWLPAKHSHKAAQPGQLAKATKAVINDTTENRMKTLPQQQVIHTAAKQIITTGKPVVQADSPAITPLSPVAEVQSYSHEASPKTSEQPLPEPRLLISDHYTVPDIQPARRLFVDVNGGYNLNALGNGFSVGLNVRRTLNQRFRVDAGINLMSGQNHTYRKQDYGSTHQGPDQYNPATAPVFYLQASPSFSYRLFKKIYTGAGMDVQRLITSTSRALILDSTGAVTGSQPAWDFGLMLRMDYQISAKIKAGLSYRESLGGFSSGASRLISRDYMLVQVSYNLY